MKCLTCPHARDFGTDVISRNRYATNHLTTYPTHDAALLETVVTARWAGGEVQRTL